MKDLINKVLNMNYWPEELKTMEPYFVTQDDCEGDKFNGLEIMISPDGDVWVRSTKDQCRFRMPWIGGGKYPKVRNALLVLAEAIRQEKEK